MLMRILESVRRHRLLLLLMALAYSAIFYGGSCSECNCSGDPYWIKYGGEGREIWVEENVPCTLPLELVAVAQGVTVSNVIWSITSAPSEGIIKPDGYEIIPTTGQQVSLKLSPQPSFNAAAIGTTTCSHYLVTKLGVKADFTSSSAQATKTVGRELFIFAMQPSLEVYGSSGAPFLSKSDSKHGKRAVVDCAFDNPNDIKTMILNVAVDYGSGWKPYQFFAKVGPPYRQYLTINRIETVNPEAANIHLTLYRGEPQPGNLEMFSFPLLLLAEGANGVSVKDIVDIHIFR